MTPDDSRIPVTERMRYRILDELPGEPDDEIYGIIYEGIPMPRDGMGYVVRLLPAELIDLLAYIDSYGRVFSTGRPEAIPPARFASLKLGIYGDEEDAGDISLVAADGALRRVAGLERNSTRYSIVDSPIDVSDLGEMDLRTCSAVAYLLFRHIPAITNGEPAAALLKSIARCLGEFAPLEAFRRIAELAGADGAADDADPARTGSGIAKFLAKQLEDTGILGLAEADLYASPDAQACNPADPTEEDGEYAELSAMLEELEGFDDIPIATLADADVQGGRETPATPLRLIRTARYADTYFLDYDGAALAPGIEPVLLAAEAALNRALLISRRAAACDDLAMDIAACSALSRSLVRTVASQAPDPRLPLPADGEWDARLNLARLLERLQLPYRSTSAFRMDLAAGCLIIETETCGPVSMAKTAADELGWHDIAPEERNAAASSYAAGLAILDAACGFACAPGIDDVAVNIVRTEEDGRPCVLSLETSREAFSAAWADEGGLFSGDPIEAIAVLSARFSCTGALDLERIEPVAPFDDARFNPPARHLDISRCTCEFDEGTREILGVDRVCDLAIFEDGERSLLADRILTALETGVDAGMAETKDIHDSSENVLVRNACRNILAGIEDGTLDANSYLEIHEALSDIYGLKELEARASSFNETSPDTAMKLYGEILARVDANKWFADTDTTCYRYFDSYASRVLYARMSDDARRVLPIADEPFLAHDWIAFHLLDTFESGAGGLEHAKECCRLAPTVCIGPRHCARIFFFAGDLPAEIDACKLIFATTVQRDAIALAYYWLGYAFWKTGKPELGAICYRRSMVLDATLADRASMELEELLSENRLLVPLSRREEDEKLLKAGVPIDELANNIAFIERIAHAAANAGSFPLAQVLLSQILGYLEDDAYYPLFKSLDR